MEDAIFRRYQVIVHLLIPYGFMKTNHAYVYRKYFFNDEFQAIITIHQGNVSGRVIDQNTMEEYVNLRIQSQTGSFVQQVRSEYESILLDIRNHCFEERCFISDQANRIHECIMKRFSNPVEHPWKKDPYSAVYRNPQSQKWYALILRVIDKQDISNQEDVLNIKLDPEEIKELLKKRGFQSAYHMNKKHWITIILNDTCTDDQIMALIEKSHAFT